MERTPEKLRVRFALCQPTLGGAAFGIRLRRRVIFREKLHQLARILAAKRAHLRALVVPPIVALFPPSSFRGAQSASPDSTTADRRYGFRAFSPPPIPAL